MAMVGDWEAAVKDLGQYDLAVDLVGSRKTDLAQPDSDINVLVSMPLKYLRKEVESATPPVYTVSKKVHAFCRDNVLHLIHISSRAELAVMSRWSADIFIRERDDLMRLVMEFDERIAHVLRRIGSWYRKYKAEMPPEKGFPNRYVFMLTGIHFMMARVMGHVLPPLAAAGPFINKESSTWMAGKKSSGVTENDLYNEWLRKIARSDKKGLFADIRNPYYEGSDPVPDKWRVVDPATCLDTCNFNLKQEENNGQVIAQMAQQEIAAIKAIEDAKEGR